MPYNDVAGGTGGIQRCETWTGKNAGEIGSDTALLKTFTNLINDGFDDDMPLLLSYSDKLRFDDTNHTDLPIGTFNIVSGQADYSIAQDDNSLDILNVTDARIVPSATSTTFQTLEKMTIDDPRAVTAMSPNSTDTGIPTHYLERGNTLFLYPKPNYSATSGAKIFFERNPSYFIYTDTTKQPGIPRPFHVLPFLRASLMWLLVNKPTNTALIRSLQEKIAGKRQELDDLISARYPTRQRVSVSQESNK